MPKRKNPFVEYSPFQMKSHIGVKEVDLGINKEENMKSVYERTKNLLFQGSRKACEHNTLSAELMKPTESPHHQSQPEPGQMTLDSTGHIIRAANGHSGVVINGDCQTVLGGDQHQFTPPIGVTSMDMDTAPPSVILPRGQLQINPSGHLCSGLKVRQAGAVSHNGCVSCQQRIGERRCHFCDKPTCMLCMRQCCTCEGSFCTFCSNMDFDGNFERPYCLQCR